ncbi:phosphoglucomutase [Shewanella mangrovi]|uniref:Phosphoglucomutase n=1 Tax=Shewanella mangrovi TaxID=1515746 RepID=A0A094JDU0_9GAMM|nr:phospho-sugar mutase [Shewanella mangrovi]KFZ38095.1 phosphoglucomutase [Shewanella mangrovi]
MDSQLALVLKNWLALDPDQATKMELAKLINAGDEQALRQRFDGRLAFGTAGLRGVVGAGPTRMNLLVIRQTAAGLGQYLLNQLADAADRGVVIGYDGRPDSLRFAHNTAEVLCSLGIKVYLTNQVCPTPLVAFGVKHLNAAAGVVVTASHNPPEYNGFKVYWENGAQIIPPHDAGIAACIEMAATTEVRTLALEKAEKQQLLQWLDDDFFSAYQQAVASSELLQSTAQKDEIVIAYTAMHGVGADMAKRLLAQAGFDKVYSVAAQEQPDGSFPTVKFPNPEEPGAMDLVINEARRHDALIACANDPDADRLAVAVKRGSDYQQLTGDQVGLLLGHYLLSKATPQQRLVGTTIVSSSMLAAVAQAAGGKCFTTLTGFKWLTNVAMQQETAEQQFLFAYEEALGYTIGTLVRDKDGLTALLAFAQLMAELVAQDKTLWQHLDEIYRQHGMYLNKQVSIALSADTADIGTKLRNEPPAVIAGIAVVAIEDIKRGVRIDVDGEQALDLPKSDVLVYHLQDQSRVVVRPSGTEPKLKCYYQVVQTLGDDTYAVAEVKGSERLNKLISQHQHSLLG